MPKRYSLYLALAVVPLLCLTAGLVYTLPPVNSRVAWRVESLITRIRHTLNPPEQQVFVPQQQSDEEIIQTIVAATLQSAAATGTAEAALLPSPTQPVTDTPGPTATPTPQPTPTLTPTPLPAAANISGTRHEYQKFNNCGPATLSMALTFWGWEGDQLVTRSYLRPLADEVDDKNVSPAEMVTFVESQAGLKAIARVGGDLDTLKRFIAAGFPVIVEKGLQQHPKDWLGHYILVTGYDDERQRFMTQDALIMPDLPVPYEAFAPQWWRDFNNTYIVVYPPERESEVMALLGPHADPSYNFQAAVEHAEQEIPTLSGRDQFFAYYNLGTNRVALGDTLGAAAAYDQAFAVYPTIPEDDRPWRMLWYQPGPYEAYYHTGRYQDVIDLANTTLTVLGKPTLEETLYWRGLAKDALGDRAGAVDDLRRAADLNPNFTLAREQLQLLGGN